MKNTINYMLILFVSLVFLFGFIGMQEDIWKAPEAAKKIKNPTINLGASLKKGKRLYRTNCAICHGKTGLGDGPGGKALVPVPESLNTPLVQNQTDGELFWKITNGRNDMIKWGPILSKEQRWDLVNYMRTLHKK